ncbi:MAG: hypothetical protein HETSPECPRED_010261 [Heterodermia speciosa]|uniref:Uncharacterized protein n=1 Tax=Heterodermia speciosa TaxID=116794 RepID=A0A8H3EY67_9LECA|nr:MAG: hypothetical protein HETSPECPRED_010261 [Heterodermia speciosa]
MGLFDRTPKSDSIHKASKATNIGSTEANDIGPSSQKSNILKRVFERKDGFSTLKPTKEEKEAEKMAKGFRRMAEMQSSQRMYGYVPTSANAESQM